MLSDSEFFILARDRFTNLSDIAREAMELIDKIVAKKETKVVGDHEIVITYTAQRFFIDVFDLKAEKECVIAACNEDKEELKKLVAMLL